MKTEDLINVLSQNRPPRPPLSILMAGVLMALAITLSVLATMGPRPDILAGEFSGGFWFKTSFLTTIFITSLLALDRASRPQPDAGIFFRFFVMLWLLLALITVLQAFVQPVETFRHIVLSKYMFACVAFVSLYGVLGMIAFVKIVQHYAPGSARTAGRMIGLSATAAGALGYAFHCPVDEPLHILVAFGIPSLILALVGTLIAPRFLKW